MIKKKTNCCFSSKRLPGMIWFPKTITTGNLPSISAQKGSEVEEKLWNKQIDRKTDILSI